MKWYIDSLDARAGLAFASFRDPDLVQGGALEDALTTVFIAPPGFEPETVANRAVAFGAQRGAFQYGLFVDETGEEFPFGTLEGVAEFVRRAYLRSGGGDANPDGGPAAPAPQGPGEPPLLPLGEREGAEGDSVTWLLAGASRFATDVRACRPGDEFLFAYWSSRPLALHPALAPTSRDLAAAARAGDRLARAALVLVAEVIRRLPPNPELDAGARWLLRAHRLAGLVDRLGLWPLMADLLRLRAGVAAFATASRQFTADLPRLHLPAEALHASTGMDYERCVLNAARALLVTGEAPVQPPPTEPTWAWLHWQFGAAPADSDPFDDLDLIGIPVALMPGEPGNNPSLRSLLLAVAANPAMLAARDPYAELKAELVLLAAAYLTRSEVAAYHRPWASVRLYAPEPPVPHAITQVAWRRVEAATAWLANNLARKVYAPQAEQMIEGAVQLEYA